MTKRILVIGSQGYLGSRLTDFLQQYGYYCMGIDVGFFQHGVLYEPRPVPTLAKDARILEEKDIEGFDVVLQLAAISNDPFGNIDSETIYGPTRNYALKVAKLCKALGVRYIFPSSCSVYGIGEEKMDETSPTNPQTHYSLNKLEIEHALSSISDSNFSPIALRLATVFGVSPRIRFDVVVNMLCGLGLTKGEIVLNSNGQSWRPHVCIEDVCEAFRCCIEWDYRGGSLMVLNVGRNDNNWKIIDVAREIQKQISGCKLKFLESLTESRQKEDDLISDTKIQDGVDKRTYRVDFDKIHCTLPTFEASWDVGNGIALLLKELTDCRLAESTFNRRDFYRLQQIRFLHEAGRIDDELIWAHH